MFSNYYQGAKEVDTDETHMLMLVHVLVQYILHVLRNVSRV